MIQIHNTLTGKKEEFSPLRDSVVTMYVCGVTPYDEVHLGHARVYVTFDTLRRFLERSGYRVKYIQNFTDVDDKIINRARERSLSPRQLAQHYIDDYFTQMDKLNVRRADAYPRVTESIPSIIEFIGTLLEKKKAYALDGDVYFSVRKFEKYGELSGRSVDELLSGARVEVDERKKDPLDFALWKKAKEDEPPEVVWDSPWGKGRPGWHIECSVMSIKCLGPTLDIHGGGQDLIFPHHENERAQSEAATGKPFVRFWVHNGFVTLNREKMSKSLGNFFTLNDIFKKYPPRVVRYFLLSQHYRSPLDFSDDKLAQAARALEGLDEAFQKLLALFPDGPATAGTETLPEVVDCFTAALDDDFNTEKAIAVVHELKKDILSLLGRKDIPFLRKAFATFTLLLDSYLGISVPRRDQYPAEVLEMKTGREKARKEKNWAYADELRRKLDARGYKIEDNPDGSSTLLKKTQ